MKCFRKDFKAINFNWFNHWFNNMLNVVLLPTTYLRLMIKQFLFYWLFYIVLQLVATLNLHRWNLHFLYIFSCSCRHNSWSLCNRTDWASKTIIHKFYLQQMWVRMTTWKCWFYLYFTSNRYFLTHKRGMDFIMIAYKIIQAKSIHRCN